MSPIQSKQHKNIHQLVLPCSLTPAASASRIALLYQSRSSRVYAGRTRIRCLVATAVWRSRRCTVCGCRRTKTRCTRNLSARSVRVRRPANLTYRHVSGRCVPCCRCSSRCAATGTIRRFATTQTATRTARFVDVPNLESITKFRNASSRCVEEVVGLRRDPDRLRYHRQTRRSIRKLSHVPMSEQ